MVKVDLPTEPGEVSSDERWLGTVDHLLGYEMRRRIRVKYISGSAKKNGSPMNAANRIELAQVTVTKHALDRRIRTYPRERTHGSDCKGICHTHEY